MQTSSWLLTFIVISGSLNQIHGAIVDNCTVKLIDENSVRKGDALYVQSTEGEIVENTFSLPFDPNRVKPIPLLTFEKASKSKQQKQITQYNMPHSYNIRTREEIIYSRDEAPTTFDETISYGAIGDLSLQSPPPDSVQLSLFPDLSLVANPENSPWRRTCQLFIEFPNGDMGVGSASLIDSKHAITAGHCIFDHDRGGWAQSVYVNPGYSNHTYPYGIGAAEQLHSWTGWTVDEEADHDIGIIDLDRPIGALTGWNGYGYNNNPDFYTSNVFSNPGYPAEDPYDGEHMYNRTGTFDDTDTFLGNWTGHKVWIDKRSYHGQSGSPAYLTSSNVIYAVLSGGINILWINNSGFPRITSDKFSDIRDSFIATDIPSSVDFVAMDMNASPDTIEAGSKLSSLNYLVHNYSSAGWSGTITVEVYLSTNSTISSSDTLLETHTITHTFDSKSSVRINHSDPPYIPANTPEGNYYIGIILDIVDYDTSNNDASVQDAFFISVTPTTDDNYEENDTLETAYNLSSQERTWLSSINGFGIQSDDDWYKIDVTSGYENVLVDCQFTHSAGDIDIALYNASGNELTSSTSTSDDEYIDCVVPSPGIYYIKVYYDDAANTYDLWWDDVRYIPPQPNLSFDSFQIDDDILGGSAGNGNGQVNAGETVELLVTLKNTGSADAHSVSAHLNTSDSYVTSISDADEGYGDIVSGGMGTCGADYDFTVSPSCPDGHIITFELDPIDSAEGTWVTVFNSLFMRT